jgi:predicted AlkP superfamily phosphohydrolase/phosphomutase
MRVFLFGVDGLTFRVLHPLMGRGLLPNFQRLQREGVEGILKSTTPPVTPPAWTSISTGLSPARHGVYDFWDYEQSEQGPHAMVMTHRRGGKAIWNILSEWGKRVIVANVPMTYPPEPVNGIMLSGYMAPDMSAHVTYPASFQEVLLELVPEYQIDLHPAVSCGQTGNLTAEVIDMTKHRIAMQRLLLKEEWDFFFLAHMGADRIQHMRWDELMTFKTQEVEYYQLLDESLGLVLAALAPDDLLMVVSDHGFQGARRKFYIQEYLHRHGWLRMKDESARQQAEMIGTIRAAIRTLKLQKIARRVFRQLRRKGIMEMEKEHHPARLPDLDWTKARAWIPSSSGALAGYADIFFDATVSEEEIQQLQNDLCSLRDPDNGQLLITEAHRESAYGRGSFAPKERHLIVQTGENTTLPTELGRRSLWETRGTNGRGVSSGVHHPEGVLYLYGTGVKHGASIAPTHVYDIVPTILARMGVSLPDELEGKVIADAFAQPASHSTTAQDSIVMQKLKKLTSHVIEQRKAELGVAEN